MRVAIQGLGEVPATVEVVLKKERPARTYVVCSDYQLKLVATRAGYKKTNEEVIKEAARKTGTEVIFCKCDAFDPKSISRAIKRALKQIDIERDEILINFTGGSAITRLLLGVTGVMLSGFARSRLIYAIQYPKGPKFEVDQTKALRDVFPSDLQLLLDFMGKIRHLGGPKIPRRKRKA